ncbi:MAG: xylS [Paenibacillus sp.]|jgi:alpha-glucosidase (family GH31 glycosyl hydrolase)/AraC-like DNA-binding protein|nr:xylS [Paenibacillus sp.]
MTAGKSEVKVELNNGLWIQVRPISPYTFQVQFNQSGIFPESALARYGILQQANRRCEFLQEASGDSVAIRTGQTTLLIDRNNGALIMKDSSGHTVATTSGTPRFDASGGFGIQFPLNNGEMLYGLGDVARDRIQRRGLRVQMWVSNYTAFSPVPFVMSSRGWAVMVNTTWKHSIDLGSENGNQITIEGTNGELDLYLFAGKPYGELLERYTDLVGKPAMLPIWAYGLTFISNENSNAREVIEDALKFRQMKIPCDMIGLSGWTEHRRDLSTSKKWNSAKFLVSEDNKRAAFSFAGMMQQNGFKLNVLLGCDYDVSAYEERLASAAGSTLELTEEKWYDHLQKFVDDGVRSFKLSGGNQIFEHPDRAWANGMSDEEMHNLYPILLSKQMHQGFARQTGKRPMIYSSVGYTGSQQFVAMNMSGYGPQREEAVTAMLNHSLTSQAHPTCDMDVNTAEGIHFGFLLPWSQINSWAYFRHPSYLDQSLQALFKTYAELRYKLIPYLYSAAHLASLKGIPIMRAMPIMFPNNSECSQLRQQYMLGDSLLVVAFTDRVYLPEGVWINYWTGERLQGPAHLRCEISDGTGGLLFIRAGAIIPMWPPMDYVGQVAIECIQLHFFPHGTSEFALYEDDGETFQYQFGQIAITNLYCQAEDGRLAIRIARRNGSYETMPAKRSYDLFIHTSCEPAELTCNNIHVPERKPSAGQTELGGWHYEEATGVVRMYIEEADDCAGFNEIVLAFFQKNRQERGEQPEPGIRQTEEAGADSDQRLQAALQTANLDVIVPVLRVWWEAGMAGAANKDAHRWRAHLMNGCLTMIRYAEHRGWSAEHVFGSDLERAYRLNDISSPEQGYRLMLSYVRHTLVYTQKPGSPEEHPLILEVKSIVAGEIDKKLSVNEIAERLFVNASYLSRLFRKATGQTLSDYILEFRMKRAKALLHSGIKVYEAAAMTGYPDPAYFSRSYRKYWGTAPFRSKKEGY